MKAKYGKILKVETSKHFPAFIISYVYVLYNYGRKIINDKDLVEDCIEDLFFELWESKEKLRYSKLLSSRS